MTLETDPIRGGIHTIFGLFTGDIVLNYGYNIKKSPYKLTTQLFTPKKASPPKRSLVYVRSDSSKMKFHRKLETLADCVTEYYKE